MKLFERELLAKNQVVLGCVTSINGLENIGEAQLNIDKKNYHIVIRVKYDKNLNNYSDEDVISYNIDDISDYKYEGCYTQKIINQTVVREHFKLIISDIHCIAFYIEKTCLNSEGNEDVRLNDNDKSLRLNLILPFIHLIEDEVTISWVNEFCESNDLLPLFDESGEVSVSNMKENARLINI